VRGRLRRIVGIGPTFGPLGEQLAEFELVKAGEVEIKPRTMIPEVAILHQESVLPRRRYG
jgi:hypothetical protein